MVLRSNKVLRCLILLIVGVLIQGYIAPLPPADAAMEFTDSVKSSLEKTAEAAGGNTKTRLIKQYNDLAALQKQMNAQDAKTTSLRLSNETRLTEVRKQITNLDADKVLKLDNQAKAARSKLQPLLDLHSSLNKQAAAVKSLKDKSLYKTLKQKADAMKPAIDLARLHIRNREAELKTAKSEKTRKAKELRSVLSQIDAVKIKLKAERSAISSKNKSITTEWKNFKTALKNKDAGRAENTLNRLSNLSKQVLTHKQNMYKHEVQISDIIKKAAARLPSK
ncbi:hypothetical protein [Paenibacillus bouchesdurhonensis]|uniref:hypothetical protein n=1 Tax=Paenibacillus bouchesdurhonensis TaxID=1870990 RepID=UPI000DA634C5|nr:hypothetical protein [Paenibacillus bouchesdurhonensis]